MSELDVLLEDGPLIAVNKPAGIPTQSADEAIDSVERRVKSFLKEKYDKEGNVYLGIPHRIDLPVSGVIVFARNSKAAARLSEQFAGRTVKKSYRAVLEGELPQSRGLLHDWMRKIPDQAKAEIVDEDHPDAKEARLLYRICKSWNHAEESPRTLVEIELLTGRMHQIRLQFGSRGFPIAGDTEYGSHAAISPTAASPCILLHARELSLKHPVRYDEVTISAPLPSNWPLESRDD